MAKNILFLTLLLFLLSACTTSPNIPAEDKIIDNNEPVKEIIVDEKDAIENADAGKEQSEVKGLLKIAETKITSISYKYQGPETGNNLYEFYVKGNKIKYNPEPDYKAIDLDKDAYDAIYLDTSSKTAFASCDARQCKVKGKKADLNYNEVYIRTPLDWLGKLDSPQKAGEEQIENRNVWILSEGNVTLWVDTFYGVPLRAETEESYKFRQMTFNGVKDEDVVSKS